MFADITRLYVRSAIESEFNNAVASYGYQYNSAHEGYAVLKEEVDEARDEYINIKNSLYTLWNDVRKNSMTETDVKRISDHAEKLALEATQIAAVCQKIMNGFKG